MRNLHQHSLDTDYRKLECGDILFVEYKCIPDYLELNSLWSPLGHLVYVTAGTKTWITANGEIPAIAGDAVFCKPGACHMRNYFETDFCALIFFFPRNLIQEVVLENNLEQLEIHGSFEFQAYKLNLNEGMKLYFKSVSNFLFENDATSPQLVKLKFKELILQILTTDNNPELKSYLLSMLNDTKNSIEIVMRKNILYNLSIKDYANLCNRSLSTFNRDFKATFGVTPLQWVLKERLKYSKMRLLSTDEDINTIAFYSGFESTSHFIRSFKKFYGLPPLRFRKQEK